MALNKHFTYDFEDRPTPKLWLLKPDFTRIERISGITKLQGTFKHNNINQLSFQVAPVIFDESEHESRTNSIYNMIKNKYIIEYHYNGFKDLLVIDDIKKVSNESDSIQVVADSLCTELNKKSANEIELLGTELNEMINKIFESYAPLWSIKYVDPKLREVKRELQATNSTVMGLIDQVNTQFDSVAIFNNLSREVSFYHKDNVGTNRGLRIRENSYLKSFEDQTLSKDIITRLYPFGNNGLTIQGVNPAGTDYIEDFSYFMHPFKRDVNRNVIKHSDYMSDNLCHALLDYKDYYDSKKEYAEQLTKKYSDLLGEFTQEQFKLNQLSAILDRQNQRKEILTPKSEYIDLGIKKQSFDIIVEKSSYYVLMIKNNGNLARIKFQGNSYDIQKNDWLYLKIDSGDFQDATKYKEKLTYNIKALSSNVNLHVVLTRSSKEDFEDENTKHIEEKYNYEKYKVLVSNQSKALSVVEKRMKVLENEKKSLIDSMHPKNFLSEELYKEREQFVYGGIWQQENHTEAKELYDDAIIQMKKQKKLNRQLTISVVNFIQSLEDKHNWDKLVTGDIITFSNKVFNEKLKAYITDMTINFDDNSVTLTVSDVIDYKDMSEKVSELIASTASNAGQVNFHKQQIRDQKGKLTKMSRLIQGEWDANKKRIMAGNETVDIGSHGVKVVSNENPNEYVIMVGGVIAMTKDGGETFKTGVTPSGINAEMVIGSMIIGETLTLENESGTVRFDKDGLTANVSNFNLLANDGNDYFETLKNQMREENKVQNDIIRDEFARKIDEAINEANDVDYIVETTSKVLQETFKDGIITDVEKRLIEQTLSNLEKENAEYMQQVDSAYNSPYILLDDIVKLDEAVLIYNGLYQSLVMNINETVKDKEITSQESKTVNESLIQFKDEVKELMLLVQEILERTKENQLKQIVEDSKSYAERIQADMKDEMSDLKTSIQKANDLIEQSSADNIFDSIEIENIKTVLMIISSELGDITNRYTTVIQNKQLDKEDKAPLETAYNSLFNTHKAFIEYVEDMIEDGKSDDQEKFNYKTKYQNYKNHLALFEEKYTEAVLKISENYSKDNEGYILGQFNSLKEEINNDLKDLKDNIGEIENVVSETFKDGIITLQEKSRLMVHLDMLDREFKDVEEQYATLMSNKYINDEIRQLVSNKRSAYTPTHTRLRELINKVIADEKIDAQEKQDVTQLLNDYNKKLSEYTSAITDGLAKMSVNAASDIAAQQAEKFNALISQVNSEVESLQKQVDGAIETHYISHKPTLSNKPASEWATNDIKDAHIGDYLLDTKTGLAYRFIKAETEYTWQLVEDQIITNALTSAKNAQDTADGKRRVFVREPKPPYDPGDIWTQGRLGDILVCKQARTSGQVYVSSDWIKASKYTDDTVANKVQADLDAYKNKVSKDIEGLKSLTSEIDKKVLDAFEDRLISIEEDSSLKAILMMLNVERNRINKQGETISNNSQLSRNLKTKVSQKLRVLLTNLDNVTNLIKNSISDKKVSEEENASVQQSLELYKQSISDYEATINEALQDIIANTAKQASQLVQERFDEWKSSEFNTTAEQIASRVSGAQWRDSYLPEVESKLQEQNTKIEASNSFIQQNKDKITHAVSKSELDAQLQKISTYETTYQVQNKQAQVLREVNGNEFNDNYSYEVTAKTRSNTTVTGATALFTSKGTGKGFNLTIIDEKGTNTVHPLFELNERGKPTINLYQSYSRTADIDVIYTKYLGTTTNYERLDSKIDQTSNNITLEVKELASKNQLNNLIPNTDFGSDELGWTDSYSSSRNFRVPKLSEMSINSDENLLLDSGYRSNLVGYNGQSHINYKLAKPLEPNKKYTLQFEYESDAYLNGLTVMPSAPQGNQERVILNRDEKNVLTFTANSQSKELNIYFGYIGSTISNSKLSILRATLVEGENALDYRGSKSHRVAEMTFSNNNSYPTFSTPFSMVGKSADYAVGDILTFSTYIYVPSSAKPYLNGNIYIEVATYENTKQISNPYFMRASIAPHEVKYDEWFRISCTGTVPSQSTNGETKYLRALLRYNGTSSYANSNLKIYYGLPKLEFGSVVTPWAKNKSDSLDMDHITSRIAINPESIEMITRNLRINTDMTVIENTNGNLTFSGDTLSITDKSNNDSLTLSPKGITQIKDGVTKLENGYDMNSANVQAYEPQFYSTNYVASEPTNAKYNNKPHVDISVFTGVYVLDWGTYDYGKRHKQLIENGGTLWARVNRYTYDYTKRYLMIELSCINNVADVTLHLRWRTTTGGTTLHEEKIKSTSWVTPTIVIDLEKKLGMKPNNKTRIFELQAALTGAKATFHAGTFRIKRTVLTDIKP